MTAPAPVVVALLLAAVSAAAGARAPAQEGAQGASPPIVTSLTLFAGTPDGLWQSTNWGGSWERQMGEKSGESLAAIGEVHTIVVLTLRVYVGAATGLYVSEDFGQTWEKRPVEVAVFSLLPSRYAEADPTIFVGTSEGLMTSRDVGRKLQPTPLTGAMVRRIEWPGPALVVATEDGVHFSNDAGRMFAAAGPGLPEGGVTALALSSFYAVDPVLFVGVGESGAFRSGDGGRSWSHAGLSGQRVHDLVWLGPLLYAATDAGLFRSQDAGRNWVALGQGLEGREVRRLLFPLAPDSGAELFVATDAGVFRSADGGMRFRAAGLAEASVNVVATFPPPQPLPQKPDAPRRRRRR